MTINDSNWQFLHDATGLSLTYNDMYYRYLRGLGYTGTLQQMIAKSEKGINPSGLDNPSSGGYYPFINTEAEQVVNRFSVVPDDDRKALIDTLVGSLKTAGVWSKLDAFYIMAASDSQAAKINWIANQFNCTEINSPTFTVDRGFNGDGLTSYLDTGFNSTTAILPKFLRDGHSFGVYVQSGPRTNNALFGTFSNPGVGGSWIVPCRLDTDTIRTRSVASTSPDSSVATTTPLGLTSVSRESSSSYKAYRGGTLVGTHVVTSEAPINEPFQVGRAGSVLATHRVAVAYIGGALTQTEVNSINSALSSYLSAIGA